MRCWHTARTWPRYRVLAYGTLKLDMTERLYHANQRLTEFCATVVDRLTWDGHRAVVLDRTAFYPESGGQPSDRGKIDGVDVLDVVSGEGGAIVHVLAGAIPGVRVCGVVEWERRFDHMQQHTGQHILSAAFEHLLDAETVGFHLGADSSTVDIAVPRLTAEAVAGVEDRVNRVIWENRPTTARFLDDEEMVSLSLRRAPAVDAPIRIVTVLGSSADPGACFDANPCGGTHVASTGEIGLLKIVRLEYRGEETRVEFLCGGRALRDYATKHGVVTGLAGHLTVGYWELDEAVGRIEDEAKRVRRDLKKAELRLAEYEAHELARSGSPWGPYRLVARVLVDRSPADLRSLAQRLSERPGSVALLATTGERSQLCFARADDVDVDVAALLRQACSRLDGQGGGRSHLAQGSARGADAAALEAVLAELASSCVPGCGA
jgi:alanyl-tRNA synthetase